MSAATVKSFGDFFPEARDFHRIGRFDELVHEHADFFRRQLANFFELLCVAHDLGQFRRRQAVNLVDDLGGGHGRKIGDCEGWSTRFMGEDIRVRPEHIHTTLRQFAGITDHPLSKKSPLGVTERGFLQGVVWDYASFAATICSSFTMSAENLRMPSAVFSVAIASSFIK